MPSYTIRVTVDATRITEVQRRLEMAFRNDGKEIRYETRKHERAPSRADRLEEIRQTVQDAAGDIEGLKEELEAWKDSMPENLQSGSKADEVDEAVSALDEIYNALDNLDWEQVSFPGMF